LNEIRRNLYGLPFPHVTAEQLVTRYKRHNDDVISYFSQRPADLGQLVFGAQTILKEASRIEVDRVLFESYLDGLRDAGCHVDPQWVRFGYTATAALRVGLFQLYLLAERLKQNQTGADQTGEHPAVPDCFEVAMAKDAYELLDRIR
jgi:hypothetical protein